MKWPTALVPGCAALCFGGAGGHHERLDGSLCGLILAAKPMWYFLSGFGLKVFPACDHRCTADTKTDTYRVKSSIEEQ
jgi:hypothetical protein